ncbi:MULTISPECIES: HNH endonuclease signature motif containing protein [unclassified Nocardioides]|uniref:HNH endonuclease signature motif containing protein n=1 Tax=unclassified Nocardioides TaxID=2615069 RepID=UPI0009EA1A74|nr:MULTISPECIES: HNH endonuclease signature motif containing protein [unclassified Nocardioides]
MPGRKRRWSDEELEAAVRSSLSLATVRGAIAASGLDTSHFGGQAWSKGIVRGPRRPIDDYLSNRFPISSSNLKMRLVREEIFVAQCNKCGGTEWMGQPMPLELEHRDGNSCNNVLANLELLCPNCHAQTPTCRSRNRKRA